MSLLMSGLDCHRAGVELREKLAFSRQQVQDCVGWMAAQPGISGCVLLSTCNRTEIYLSGDAELSPWRLLCRWANAPEDALEPYFTTRIGEEAAGHLMQVACTPRFWGRIRLLPRCASPWSLPRRAVGQTPPWRPCSAGR